MFGGLHRQKATSQPDEYLWKVEPRNSGALGFAKEPANLLNFEGMRGGFLRG
jgi:hypothetical protein